MTSLDLAPEHRNWAMACHLAAFAGYFIPFGHILGPLVVLLFKGESHPFVNAQGREALNFQISITLYLLVAALLIAVVIGVFLIAALALFDFIFIIVATVKAKNGETYRYPLTIRFIK